MLGVVSPFSFQPIFIFMTESGALEGPLALPSHLSLEGKAKWPGVLYARVSHPGGGHDATMTARLAWLLRVGPTHRDEGLLPVLFMTFSMAS